VSQLERGESGCRTDVAVQREFDHRAFDFPVLLVFVNNGPQYLVDQSVRLLGRAICLRMEHGGHEELSPHEPLKFTPENRPELGVSVGHYGV
jgi:hypothetical protein